MASPTPISDIPTLPTLYKNNKLSTPINTLAPPSATLNSKISLVRTDITTLPVTAIVNAANESLLGGGGVDGAIHRAAGPNLVKECRTLDGCDTGSAKITHAYDLPCKYVIHAVGPVYWSAKRDGEDVPAQLLAGCYTTSLDLLVGAGGGSIAFSALSTGIYGYPSGEAAEVAVGAVRRWLDADEERAGKVERVVFCSFLAKDESAYEEIVPRFFPPAAEESEDANTKGIGGATDGTTDEKIAAEAGADGKGPIEDETAIPDLPDVPKDDPKEPGQPEHKKAKLDDGEQR